jgi:hypothetical protein
MSPTSVQITKPLTQWSETTMGTVMQNQANAILNGMDEATVATIITLYDKGWLKRIYSEEFGKRLDLTHYLSEAGMTNPHSVSYWLDYFRV